MKRTREVLQKRLTRGETDIYRERKREREGERERGREEIISVVLMRPVVACLRIVGSRLLAVHSRGCFSR